MKANKTITVQGMSFVVKESRFKLSTTVQGLLISAMNMTELKAKIKNVLNS